MVKKLNPIERSKYINSRYKEYLRSSFKFGTDKLQQLFEQQLENEDLFKGPYVDMNYPFQRGHNLNQLIEDGVISESFRKLNDISFSRPLYSHQEEAIKLIKRGRSAIITTGTGSGKTECFLYPILNELLYDVEAGNKEIGIRAIFLYPMNALVNDQIDRIRVMLKNCPEIKYGFFTGETPNDAPKNYREKLSEENGVSIPENELLTREEIRKNPPHFLFTNYSMLEYLLIRPDDYAIFAPEKLNNWKYVVLDEAHTYNGSLGIEISLLLKRLTGLANKKPRFILTSATLGKEGQSEAEIVEFAKNLTSVDYSVSDIIFSKRIKISERAQYRIQGEDYTRLLESVNSIDGTKSIVSKYCEASSTNVKELLFDLLCKDKNVHELSDFLGKGCKSFAAIYQEMKERVSQNELIALIDVVNTAEKNGIGLFDLKYHSFVRPLSGAYITYGKEPKLSLTKTNEIDGMKAFEIGNCRYCSSPYLIGKIQRRDEDQMDYLFQNKEIDLYENYGNEEFVKIDFFLLENAVNEDVDMDSIQAYEVCSKCGEIHAVGNLNSQKCKCGEQYRFITYKVLQNKENNTEYIYNNISQCPCCGHRGKSGVVKALNVGKDEGTALIAQILYEAIDEDDQQVKTVKKLSLKPITTQASMSEERKVKQYLTFSDSRQQAGFAAIFFDANHIRILRKRLIWEVLKNNDFEEMKLNELTALLEDRIRATDLFANDLNSHKNAWATVLIDLLKVDGIHDGEGLGLYYFDLDINGVLDEFDDEEIAEGFPGCNMTKEKLYTLMQVVLGVFKTFPAINYAKSTLTPEEKIEVLEYQRFPNYVTLYSPQRSKKNDAKEQPVYGIRSFLPVAREDNMVVRYVMKVFNIEQAEAKGILETIFSLIVQANNLEGAEQFLIKHDRKEAYQIDAGRYIVKNYKKSQYYMCSICKRLTPYNINNKCVQDRCFGTLHEVNPDDALATNFYRQQYKNKKIEKIVIQEHTAQLDRKKAKEYQIAFKNKKINILSCSTTFEMGVDIGSLETVFMRNVPPTPANYVQRAGRAGRRKDSAAYILTYCGTGSHDYNFFSEPEKMISGVINPPFFNVLNKKIIIRHLMAASLGYFFRRYPNYFRTLDAFVISENGVERFKEYMESHPKDLNEYINKKILADVVYDEYRNYKWYDDMNGDDIKLSHFVETVRGMVKEFECALEEAKKGQSQGDIQASKNATYFINQITNLKKEDLISSLSKYCVIPKYGFPVDLVELQIYDKGVPVIDKYDMNRDLKIAISEYAPDSEVVVDKQKITSKYITLNRTGSFRKNWFVLCPTCKRINVFLNKGDNTTCRYCGVSIETKVVEYYIEPVNGFKSGETKESTRLKPKRSYAGEVSYVGNGKIDERRIIIGNTIGIETSSDDELLIMNKSGFYMCQECGYSDIDKKITTKLPRILKKHKDFRLNTCKCEELEYLRLGHKFQTDVARLTIPILDSQDKRGYPMALSFLYAFIEGVSIALGIERTDIDGILELNRDWQSYDILLYDNVPGGAGHVKRLLNSNDVIRSLKAALQKVSKECCDENTSCYNCLRNYYNQSNHSKLQRKLAIEVTNRILSEIDEATTTYQNERWQKSE